jgi:hypothetical protein
MSYFPGKLGTIVKTINNETSHVDSMTGMLTNGLREKIKQYTGRGTSWNNFEYVIYKFVANKEVEKIIKV